MALPGSIFVWEKCRPSRVTNSGSDVQHPAPQGPSCADSHSTFLHSPTGRPPEGPWARKLITKSFSPDTDVDVPRVSGEDGEWSSGSQVHGRTRESVLLYVKDQKGQKKVESGGMTMG